MELSEPAIVTPNGYTHAHQFKRARRQLKFQRTRLGRIIRDDEEPFVVQLVCAAISS